MKKLVYIASTGYSGSTLLECILGSNDSCVNLGEIYKIHTWKQCACGLDRPECDFWRQVAIELGEPIRPDGCLLGEYYGHGRRKRGAFGTPTLHDLFIASGGPRTLPLFRSLAPEVRHFHEHANKAGRLFAAAAKVANASVVVDASKDPVYLKHFHAAMPEKIRVIHLVRDARAVTWSFLKNFERDGAAYVSEEDQAPVISDICSYWLQRNRNIKMAISNVPASQKCLLRYEDLCTNPEASAAKLSDLLDVPIKIPERIEPWTQHRIASNPRLSDQRSAMSIKLTEGWRKKLSPEEFSEIESLTGKAAVAYGYR